MQKFQKWHKAAPKKSIREVQKWRRPVDDWVKCNLMEHRVKPGSREAFGEVIHNHLGEFIAAATGPIDRPRIGLHFESMAARHSIMLVQGLYMEEIKINFEGDVSLVLAAMKGQGDDCSEFDSTINDLRFFLTR